MKKLIIITIALLLVSSAFAQVDTLMLVEINSIEVSGEITEVYTESIFNEQKEFFICTDDHIYVFDSQTNDPLWSLDGITNPRDLQFGDINNDGFTDLAFRDEYNIRIYDIVNDLHVWSSPNLDSTYKCYTIGDRNDDGWLDAAIVYLIPTGEISNYDTAWISLYDGIDFSFELDSFILMPNHSDYNPFDGYIISEYPSNIEIVNITYENSLQPFIVLNSNYLHYLWVIYDPFGGGEDSLNGNSYLLDGLTLVTRNAFSSGELLSMDTKSENDSTFLVLLADRKHREYSCLSICDTEKLVQRFSADTVDSQLIWGIYDVEQVDDYLDWQGYLVSDLTNAYYGKEVCFAFKDSLFLNSFPDFDNIWFTTVLNDSIHVSDYINSPQFFENTNIICQVYASNEFQFYSSNDGSLTAKMIFADNYRMSDISDLNADGNDEILSIDGNTLRIYHLDYYTDIDQPATIPYHTFLQPSYPNPFNTSTTIEYGLASDKHVTIEIYDLLGRKVQTLINENKPAGLHQVTWDAYDMPSGVYFYMLQAGDYGKTRKMMLVK